MAKGIFRNEKGWKEIMEYKYICLVCKKPNHMGQFCSYKHSKKYYEDNPYKTEIVSRRESMISKKIEFFIVFQMLTFHPRMIYSKEHREERRSILDKIKTEINNGQK